MEQVTWPLVMKRKKPFLSLFFFFFKKISHVLLTVLVKERLVELFTVLCVSVSERENQAKKRQIRHEEILFTL